MTRMLAPMVAPAMMPTGKTSTGDGETLAGDRGQGHCQEVAVAGGYLLLLKPRCLQRPRPSWTPQCPGVAGSHGAMPALPFSSSWMIAVPGPKLFQAVQL